MGVRTFKREHKHLREITLIDGDQILIDPSQYKAHTNAKDFSDDWTAILRVHGSCPAGADDSDPSAHFLVYGMRAENGAKVAEVYELVTLEAQIPGSLDRVAAHCGLEELRATLR